MPPRYMVSRLVVTLMMRPQCCLSIDGMAARLIRKVPMTLTSMIRRNSSGVTANVLVPGGAANTRMVPTAQEPDRAKLIAPDVMVPPLLWLCSNESDGINGQRFIGMRWDKTLPPAEAAEKAGAPAAWQQLGRQSIRPESLR